MSDRLMPMLETISGTPSGYDFGYAIRHKQVDFRLSRPGNVDVGRFVIERVDDEPEAVGTMDDNHSQHNPSVGLFNPLREFNRFRGRSSQGRKMSLRYRARPLSRRCLARSTDSLSFGISCHHHDLRWLEQPLWSVQWRKADTRS